ncbi:MAG: hypothetical protein ACD_80C00206G0002, partial [uncultured bacterium (gcode 4)]
MNEPIYRDKEQNTGSSGSYFLGIFFIMVVVGFGFYYRSDLDTIW